MGPTKCIPWACTEIGIRIRVTGSTDFISLTKKKTDLISVQFVSGPKTHLHNKSNFDRISFVACGVCFSYVHKLGGLLFYFLLFYHQTQPMSANQETLAISICSSPLLLPVLLISELNLFYIIAKKISVSFSLWQQHSGTGFPTHTQMLGGGSLSTPTTTQSLKATRTISVLYPSHRLLSTHLCLFKIKVLIYVDVAEILFLYFFFIFYNTMVLIQFLVLLNLYVTQIFVFSRAQYQLPEDFHQERVVFLEVTKSISSSFLGLSLVVLHEKKQVPLCCQCILQKFHQFEYNLY